MSLLIIILISIFLGIVLLTLLAYTINIFYRSHTYIGETSDHFDGKKFYNIGWIAGETFRMTETEEEWLGKKRKNGLLTFWKWILNQKISLWKKRNVTQVVPLMKYEGSDALITYIGHATVLIQIAGMAILTDPVWSKRASPVQWIGPKRYTDPGVRFEDLPKIDIILLSHNHFDHMDITTLRKLEERDNPTIYTGLGNRKYLAKRRVMNVVEMDWWEKVAYRSEDIGGRVEHATDNREESVVGARHLSPPSSLLPPTNITFLPSQHFSARGITDRNRTLWGGFVIEVARKSIYFAGDTGYGSFIEKIQERFPEGFDYGLIPIGAYIPRWFMAAMHTSPFEGMTLQKKLSIKKSIGIHYGTFPLAGDLQDEPIEDLARAKVLPEYRDQIFEIGPSGTVWKW